MQFSLSPDRMSAQELRASLSLASIFTLRPPMFVVGFMLPALWAVTAAAMKLKRLSQVSSRIINPEIRDERAVMNLIKGGI